MHSKPIHGSVGSQLELLRRGPVSCHPRLKYGVGETGAATVATPTPSIGKRSEHQGRRHCASCGNSSFRIRSKDENPSHDNTVHVCCNELASRSFRTRRPAPQNHPDAIQL